jgi:hypothetical protein
MIVMVMVLFLVFVLLGVRLYVCTHRTECTPFSRIHMHTHT